MDSILKCVLDSKDEAERGRLQDELILTHSAPLIRKVLRQRLNLYISHSGTNPNNPNAEDLYHEIIARLLQRLNDWIGRPDDHPINNYRNLVITITVNACNDYLRGKAPARARLKNSLRDLLLRHRDFKTWKGENRKQLCGFSTWNGQSISSKGSERVRLLLENPEAFQPNLFTKGNVQSVPLPILIAGIFKWIDSPIEMDALTKLLALLLDVKEQPVESIEQSTEKFGREFKDSTIRNDLRLMGKETLKMLWDEIKQLPPEQRDVICLSLEDADGNDLWSILLTAEVMTLPQLAADLGLSIEQCMNLWEKAPMDSPTLAKHLGATRSQVNKCRFRALRRLRERMAEQKNNFV
jgi:RNA polymerase sigma factor (sigma-70 family)